MLSKKECVLLALVILAISGCTARSGPGSTPQNPATYRTGSDGLVMVIPANTPPPRVYDYQDVNVLIELENRGAHTIPGNELDRVYLSGFDPNLITDIPLQGVAIPNLEGRNQFSSGGSDVLSFTGRIISDQLVNQHQVRMMATACYHYETIAEASVCIDPDPFTTSTAPKVCIPSQVSTGTQGAPIAVQSIQLEPSTGRMRFAINVRNVGRGESFKHRELQIERCNPNSPNGLQFDEIDYVLVEDVTVSGVSILPTCKPLTPEGGYLRLVRGSGTLYCDFDNIPVSGAYSTPLRVVLAYGYRERIFRDFTIIPELT